MANIHSHQKLQLAELTNIFPHFDKLEHLMAKMDNRTDKMVQTCLDTESTPTPPSLEMQSDRGQLATTRLANRQAVCSLFGQTKSSAFESTELCDWPTSTASVPPAETG